MTQSPGGELLLLGAALLDYIVGDPWGWPHPVQVMGWAIAQGCNCEA
jgi:adenosylcobinamide-phosphate synthase